MSTCVDFADEVTAIDKGSLSGIVTQQQFQLEWVENIETVAKFRAKRQMKELADQSRHFSRHCFRVWGHGRCNSS